MIIFNLDAKSSNGVYEINEDQGDERIHRGLRHANEKFSPYSGFVNYHKFIAAINLQLYIIKDLIVYCDI